MDYWHVLPQLALLTPLCSIWTTCGPPRVLYTLPFGLSCRISLLSYLLPNFISDAESCHWKHWVSLPIQNFSYSIGCRHICWYFPWQDSLFYQSSGKNLPLSPGSFCSPFQDRLENLSMCWVPSVLQYSSGSYFSLTSSDFPPVLVLVESDFRFWLCSTEKQFWSPFSLRSLGTGKWFEFPRDLSSSWVFRGVQAGELKVVEEGGEMKS